MGKIFGPLPDPRTGNHMENPSFTGPPKFLQDLIFFNIRIRIEGLPTGIFLPDRRTGTGFSLVLHCFHRSRTEDQWISRCLLKYGWSIACQCCSNYIFILNLTLGFNWLVKDNCKTRWETFKFWDLMHLILEILRYMHILWNIPWRCVYCRT